MNPVEADANGRFPQIFAEEGAVFDIIEKDGDGNTLATYVDVSTLGDDTGTFTRTMPDGTRLKFTGSGGRVLMQVGDADPDAGGGTITFEGWAGTQGDEALFDFALVNMGTSAGALKENSKKLPSVVQTDATTFTTAATIDIPLTNSPAGVTAWDVDIFDMITSTTGVNVNWSATFSYDGGATYKTGAGDYFQVGMVFAGGVVLANPVGSAAAGASMYVAATTVISAATKVHMSLHARTPDSGAAYSSLETRTASFYRDTGVNYPAIQLSTGFGAGGYGRATHVRLTPSAGTATGKYRVMPQRGTGDA